jgi:hypothetical protein
MACIYRTANSGRIVHVAPARYWLGSRYWDSAGAATRSLGRRTPEQSLERSVVDARRTRMPEAGTGGHTYHAPEGATTLTRWIRPKSTAAPAPRGPKTHHAVSRAKVPHRISGNPPRLQPCTPILVPRRLSVSGEQSGDTSATHPSLAECDRGAHANRTLFGSIPSRTQSWGMLRSGVFLNLSAAFAWPQAALIDLPAARAR